MAASKITIEYEAKLTVSRATAEQALRIVEMYLNSHDGQYVHHNDQDDGTVVLTFESEEINDERTDSASDTDTR